MNDDGVDAVVSSALPENQAIAIPEMGGEHMYGDNPEPAEDERSIESSEIDPAMGEIVLMDNLDLNVGPN